MSGQLLLVLAAVALAGALVVSLRRAAAAAGDAGEGRAQVPVGAALAERILVALASIFVVAAVAALALMLAAGEYQVRYVWQHSAGYQPLWQRLSALLAGQEGSFLVWTLVSTVLTASTLGWVNRASRADAAAAGIAYRVMLVLTLVVLLLTLRSEPFQSFAAAFPEAAGAPVEGRGLNPVLQNPWMPLHTALTFLGYGLTGLAFALAVAQLALAARGNLSALEDGRARLRSALRRAWLAMSLALTSGIVWAFEEMTFGWYWSWDPVEAAALAIWLVLTAALHAPSGAAVRAPLRALAQPVLAASAWLVVVFASFVTRSGLHPSVHAFAGEAAGGMLGAFLALLIVALLVLTLLARARVLAARPLAQAQGAAMWWATGLPLALALLVLWGLSFPILARVLTGRTVELETLAFSLWGSVLALGILLSIGFTMRGARQRGDRRLLAGIGTLTLVAAGVVPHENLRLLSALERDGLASIYGLWGQASVLAFVPAAVYALLAIAQRARGAWSGADGAGRLRESGFALSHAGFVVVTLALVLSTLLTTSVTVHIPPNQERSSVEAGISVRAIGFERHETVDGRGVVVEQRESLSLEVFDGPRLVSSGTAHLLSYPERGMGRHARVLLERGALVDTQVIFHGLAELGPVGLPVTVRRIPLAAAVWLGAIMLALGIAVASAGRAASVHGTRVPSPGVRA